MIERAQPRTLKLLDRLPDNNEIPQMRRQPDDLRRRPKDDRRLFLRLRRRIQRRIYLVLAPTQMQQQQERGEC